jgi:hypothetical protein
MFLTLEYLWGSMPALDILNIKDHEDTTDTVHSNFNILFAASGDLRSAIKSIVRLPNGCTGGFVAALNDIDFLVMARNAIMLLIALHLDSETVVPASHDSAISREQDRLPTRDTIIPPEAMLAHGALLRP